MSSFLEIRTLTFDRASVIPIPDALNGQPSKKDWTRDGTNIDVFPVALPRTTTSTIAAKLKVRIKKVLPPLTKVRATLGSGYPMVAVRPTTLPLASIGTHVVDVHIDLPPLTDRAVGQSNVVMTWEQRPPGGAWVTFDTTTHPVFVLADEPLMPWGRPGVVNRIVPWAAVLERACRWATGKKTPASAVSEIARQAFGLGGQIIQHATNDSTTIEYGDGSSFDNGNGGFFLDDFLKTADLKPNADGFLNCSDLAGAVALLGSAIGCPVGIARIEPTSPTGKVKTHFIQLIGQSVPVRQDFEYHEFAATIVTTNASAATLGTSAWDACVKLDNTTPPATAAPNASTLEIPTNWPLHSGAAPVYATQLLTSLQQLKIDLIQSTGILFPEKSPVIGPLPVDKFLVDRQHNLDKLLEPVPLPSPASPVTINRIRTTLLRNSTGFRERVFWAMNRPYDNVVARLRPASGPQTMRMSFVIAGADAHQIFLRWAARFVSKLVVIRRLGDAALHAPQSDSIVMRIRDTVIQLTGDGQHLPTVDLVAKSLERQVKAAYGVP